MKDKRVSKDIKGRLMGEIENRLMLNELLEMFFLWSILKIIAQKHLSVFFSSFTHTGT